MDIERWTYFFTRDFNSSTKTSTKWQIHLLWNLCESINIMNYKVSIRINNSWIIIHENNLRSMIGGVGIIWLSYISKLTRSFCWSDFYWHHKSFSKNIYRTILHMVHINREFHLYLFFSIGCIEFINTFLLLRSIINR